MTDSAAMPWPRQYAAQITAEATREGRQRLLSEVPAEFREWVKRLVEMSFERRRG